MWTPESGTELTAPHVDVRVETTSMALWQEYLAGWFNGQTHSINNGDLSIKFPHVTFGFNQTRMPQPLTGVHINVISADPGRGEGKQIGGKWSTFQNVLMEFHVRASEPNPANATGKNAEYLCREAADCLYALLLDRGASQVLQSKGFRLIRPWMPKPFPETAYRLRILRCSVRYEFTSTASNPTTSTLGGD